MTSLITTHHYCTYITKGAIEAVPTMNPGLNWIKSSSSVGTGACVELARDGEMIALRDSKNPDTAPFRYTAREISAFLDGVKRGEFDHLLTTTTTGDLRTDDGTVAHGTTNRQARRLEGSIGVGAQAVMGQGSRERRK